MASETVIKQVEASKQCTGRAEYLRFLRGERISILAAVKAKCFDCCAHFEDGREDCGVEDCPLYPLDGIRQGPQGKTEKGTFRSTEGEPE